MATQKKSTGAKTGKKAGSAGKKAGKKVASKSAATKSASAKKPASKPARSTTTKASGTKHAGTEQLRASAAKVVAGGDRIREGVRDMTVAALDGATASTDALRSVVHEIMSGASSVIEDAMPKNTKSPLREVVGGLTEAASAIADGGRRAASKASKTAGQAVKGGAAMRDTALRSTHDMLAAVEKFASTLSGTARKEIDHLIAEARTTGGRLEAPTRRAGEAAVHRPVELARETAETSMRVALGATSRMMTAAGGMLSNLGGSLANAGKGSGFGMGAGTGGGGHGAKKGGKPTVAPKRGGMKTRPSAPRSRKT